MGSSSLSDPFKIGGFKFSLSDHFSRLKSSDSHLGDRRVMDERSWLRDEQMIMLMEEILHQLIGSISVYPIIFRVLYIPGGAGFQTSTVRFVRIVMS